MASTNQGGTSGGRGARDGDSSDPAIRGLAAGADGPVELRQPPGLFLLFFVEMWERFSYYGMRGLLVLYLISVLAAHQLKPGVYSNDIDIVEKSSAVDSRNLETAPAQSIPFHVIVGDSVPTPAELGAVSSRDGASAPALVLQRMKRVEDPPESKQFKWVPDEGAPLGPVTLKEDPSLGRGSERFANAEAAYRISNPTDQTVEVLISPRRPDASQPTFFTVNRSSGTVSAQIKPDRELKEGEEPFLFTVAVNAHDSGRNWTEARANTLYGWYTGLAYLLPVLGGFIADRILGTHRSMVLGGTVIAIGHVILAISGFGDWAMDKAGLSIFIAGLATIIIGTGYFKPTVSVMVGQLYKPGDPRRDGGFSIFYMGINVGAFICAFICGTLGEKVGWHWGFGSAAVGMIAGLVTYLWGRPRFLAGIGEPPPGKANIAPILLIGTLALAALVGFAYYEGFFSWLGSGITWLTQPQNAKIAKGIVYGSIAGIMAALAWFISIQKRGEKGPVFCIFVFILFNAFFWLAFEQAGSTLNVFAERNTNRDVFGVFEIPATWFQSINAGLIILLAPLFAMMWSRLGARGRNPSQPLKISLGLILLGLGYIFMVVGALRAAKGELVSPMYLFMTYLLHTMGELCLSPTGLSFVTKTAPVRFVSFLMGMWFLSSFIANLGGGLIAAQVERVEKGEIELPWNLGGRADYFMLFVVSSIGAGLIILIMTPLLKRLLGDKVNA